MQHRGEGVMQMNDHDTPPMPLGYPRALTTGGERDKMRASDRDRDHVVELLNVAFSEGRLSRDEYDGRLGNAFSARTYADLDHLVTDLPAARVPAASPAAKINGLAVASLACAFAEFLVGPLAAIPAIVFGHLARQQIKRSGEQGAGLALAGLILGWTALIIGILLVVAGGVAMSAGMPGTMH
jgi:Domain of unknown function (DUF1707)/Domain of unknown function (DUF4190)